MVLKIAGLRASGGGQEEEADEGEEGSGGVPAGRVGSGGAEDGDGGEEGDEDYYQAGDEGGFGGGGEGEAGGLELVADGEEEADDAPKRMARRVRLRRLRWLMMASAIKARAMRSRLKSSGET